MIRLDGIVPKISLFLRIFVSFLNLPIVLNSILLSTFGRKYGKKPFLTVFFHPLMPLLMPFVTNYDNLKIIRSFCIL